MHERAGIQGFDDLHDLTLAVTPAAAFTAYLRHKLPLENVQFVPYSGLEPFLRDEKFATQGYVFSEPFVARERGEIRGADALGSGLQSLYEPAGDDRE